MKYAFAVSLAVTILGCARAPVQTAQPGAIELMEGYSLGEAVSHGNATFIPILSNNMEAEQAGDDTITLAEAKKNGWVEIIEVPGEEQVEFLSVRNSGPKPLFLMSGQLLLGGKQDRIVAEDTLVPAGSTQKVPVYCVEHGRWSGGSKHFEYGDTMVPDKVRKSAQYEDQSAVWGRVAETNETVRSNAPASSSIRTFLNDEDVKMQIKETVDSISSKLNASNVVGVVFALNGEIRTLELFDSPSLYKRASRPLLESFVSEASMSKASDAKVDIAKVSEFVNLCLSAPRSDAEGVNDIAGASVRGNEYRSARKAAPLHGSFEPTK